MKHLQIITVFLLSLLSMACAGRESKYYQLLSPDKNVVLVIEAGAMLKWSVTYKKQPVIAPSAISLQLQTGEVLGNDAVIVSANADNINTVIRPINYKKASITDNYVQLVLECNGGYAVVFRAYNDGVAYRFVLKKPSPVTIVNEQASFNFDKDYRCFVPYVRDLRGKEQYIQSFESLYEEITISQFVKDTLAFLPLLADVGNEIKAVLLEADLENYPGMFVTRNPAEKHGFKGMFAPYPLEETQGGYNKLNTMVTKRADYIARVNGTCNLPWRAVVINDDASLADNDMVQKLASPSRIADPSWIKPGKVAWDWWNDWNISKVDFKAGINTATYKYYIDFAAANKIEYIILDEGWSNDFDLMQLSPGINLKEIIDYGKRKKVGVILWASWYAVNEKMEEAFAQYALMGAKGFKIDFMDRDDQKMVVSLYEIAKMAAAYKLIVDLHGMYKPTGLQRTYPNVVNFEGVKGLENVKWTPNDDVPRYDVTIPFIRMIAGPLDYTPGAMRNATKSNFKPSHTLPMSQGTRCHQMAMYVVFEAPLQMLADNPTAYIREQECTDFIAKIPTVFDQTVALSGKVGEYIAIARKHNNVWYVGAMTNWTERDMVLDFSFLAPGNYEAEIFRDGVNADRDATDYRKETLKLGGNKKISIHLSPGGGWAARIYAVK